MRSRKQARHIYGSRECPLTVYLIGTNASPCKRRRARVRGGGVRIPAYVKIFETSTRSCGMQLLLSSGRGRGR